MSEVTIKLHTLLSEISTLAQIHGRSPQDVRLVAVSKTKPTDVILDAYRAGQTAFGENYAQEFRSKRDELTKFPLEWHFIGHLQSNKAKLIVGKCTLIHTLDRLSLAQEIEKIAAAQGIVQSCLIEVKTSKEDSKTGCAPDAVADLLKQLSPLTHISVTGLMTIGTLTDDREKTRREFRLLRELRDELNRATLAREPLRELSMGMSSDYDIAIAEGATLIRVGAKIFNRFTRL